MSRWLYLYDSRGGWWRDHWDLPEDFGPPLWPKPELPVSTKPDPNYLDWMKEYKIEIQYDPWMPVDRAVLLSGKQVTILEFTDELSRRNRQRIW